MAVPTLRVVRRPKGRPIRPDSPSHLPSITAASQPVDDVAKAFRTVMGNSGRTEWQHEAWDMLDLVGELRYYVSWRAGSCSRVRFVASEFDEETGLPTGGISDDAGPEGERVKEIVQSIAGGTLGQAELSKRSAECLTVPGEHWIAIIADDDGATDADGNPVMTWLVLTRDEIKARADGGAQLELPTGKFHDFDPNVDALFRVWFRRPRRAKEADSPVRATLPSLREIVYETKKIKNASKSRLLGNGVLFIPQEMSLPAANAPIAQNQPGTPAPAVTGVPAADQLSNLLYNTANAAVKDEDSQAAFIPLMATVPGEYLEKVQHLQFGTDVTAVAIQTRNDSIARLAMGLDVSPERLLGLGTNSNHWSAWQIGDEDVQLHIKPVMETLCGAINDQVIKLVLQREGIDPAKYCLWYDASLLTQDPDKTEEASEANERGAITNEAYRRYLGLGDEDGYDFTTLEGWQLWAADAVGRNPEMITTLLPLLDSAVQTLDFPTPQTALPPSSATNPEANQEDNIPPVGTKETTPNTENKQTPSEAAHVATPVELILVERLMVTRALELAGKRRVKVNDRMMAARLRGVPAHEYHSRMPPVSEAEIPKLISGWDSALEDEVIARLGVDTEALREAVRRQVRRALTQPVIDGEVI